jgi:TrmH family RNA methyltransferase
MIVAPELLTSEFGHKMVADWRRGNKPCHEVSAEVFESLSVQGHAQGLAAVVKQHWTTLDQICPERQPVWVALSGVQDPGNLGTILRTGDGAGCSGVMLLGHTTDPFDPESVRASMGAIFSQGLLRTSLEDLLAWKAAHHYALIGTSASARVDYRTFTYPERVIAFMGSEGRGLSQEEQCACDAMVQIPMVGRSDSLNLAVATALSLYEIFYQHRQTAVPHPDQRRLSISSTHADASTDPGQLTK